MISRFFYVAMLVQQLAFSFIWCLGPFHSMLRLLECFWNIQIFQNTRHYQPRLFYTAVMQIKNNRGSRGSFGYDQQETKRDQGLTENLQYEILLHKVKNLEARYVQQNVISETLRLNNSQLEKQIQIKNLQIEKLDSENNGLKIAIADMEQQLLARKKSAEEMLREVRAESSAIREKNIKMCEIVDYLQTKVSGLEKFKKDSEIAEQGLRKRVQQLEIQNQNVRLKLAKFEVQSEKYKLKAIQGEKYWSSKFEQNKHKEQRQNNEKYRQIQSKYRDELIQLKSDLNRYQKLLKIKEERIQSLEKRIEEFVILNS